MNRGFHSIGGIPGGWGGLVILGGTFTIGSAGAITAQTGDGTAGATIAYVAAGLYTATFLVAAGPVRINLGAHATMVGPDASAFPTTTGSNPQCRVQATTGFKIQFIRPDTQADADPASGTICNWICLVQA